MTKTSSDALLSEIAADFHTYLRKGIRVDRVVGAVHPDLDIDDVETLLRIHFVLTDAERDDTDVGVLDFVRGLADEIRHIKTTTAAGTFEHRGEIRGRIDWPETTKRRARSGQFNEPVFVCRQPEERYDLDENLVLKRLLAVIYDILQTDLQNALNQPDGYGWLQDWVTPATDVGRGPESAADALARIYEQNIYLQRIDVAPADVTDRTIEGVKRSRSAFYREAAILLDRYRRLMNQDLESDDAQSILNQTIIAPEETETLFELYWIFRILDAYDAVQYRVLTDRGNPTVVARWEQDGSQYVMTHDATSGGLTFSETGIEETISPDGYLFRLNRVLDRWQTLANDLLNYDSEGKLWGGRPDIVLSRYDQDPDGERSLAAVFIGEVKYTQDIGYVATGLRELLEYMAFVRGADGAYVEDPADLLESVTVKGQLFTDDLGREIDSPDPIDIIQVSDSVERVL